MNIYTISYLMRYVFAIIIVVVTAKLVISAIKELRWAMRHSLRPAQGYYLLNETAPGTVRNLPLYHTTNIGRARSNDLRIHSDEIKRRHAVIYRYDGDWYIRPQSSSAEVILNGEKIEGNEKLKNDDIIELANNYFVFVDEPAIAKARGEVYEETAYDDDAFYSAIKRNSRDPGVDLFLINVFTLLASALIFFMMPKFMDLRKDYLLFTGIVLVLIDLYYFLLPKLLRYADRLLFVATAQLQMLGLALQARLNLIGNKNYLAAEKEGNTELMHEIAQESLKAYKVQVIAVIIGLVLLAIIALLVYKTRILENLVVLAAFVTPILLILTLIFGRGAETHGASLWINISGFSLQLTEFAKITYLITLAAFFKNRPPLKTQIKFAIWAAVVFFLYLLLPDLGSIMILLPATLLVFVVMTSEYFKTLLILVAAALMSLLAYGIFPHVRRRIDGWTSLFTEVNDSNRQVVYGLQAMGRGNIFGKGLGNGSPGGIPLVKSDMVFTILSEEFGIIVAVAVLILLFTILLRAIRTTILARDGFTSSLALGLGTTIFVEAIVVIAGTTGLIPLTGATLPFIASGGSSLLAKWFMLAILLGLASRHEEGASNK